MIWISARYDDAALKLLREGTNEYRVVLAAEAQDAAALLNEAEIIYGQPNSEVARQSSKLRWLHLDSAGYEKYDNEELSQALRAKGAVMTNSSGVYNEPCAQHVLAMMMGLARRLPSSLDLQRGDHSWPWLELRAESYLLGGQTALLLGFGAIAQRLAELLAPMGMNLIGVRRHPTGKESIRTVAEAEVEKYLPQADHVVSCLPATPGTRSFINAERLSLMKRGAIFYNIGRGSTVDQEALMSALNSNHLAAAYLDVTEPEPLPPDHPLWVTRNCLITPHTAGGHIGEKERLARHFLENLRRFTAGEKLLDQIV